MENPITMTNKSILALVISGTGDLQNGLLALVTTVPAISTVLVAESVNSALRMIESHHPGLIILDMSLPKVDQAIHEVKTQWPQIHLIVLVDDQSQQVLAEESGADSVLIKGFHAQKLVDLLENVIKSQEDLAKENLRPEDN